VTGEGTSFRIGIVGTGYMAKAHSMAYAAIRAGGFPECPLPIKRRIAGLTSDLAGRAARTLGWDEHTDDWRAVTRADDIDIVDVVTPNDLHAEIAIDALRHGKHVLCEKPLAHRLADSMRMLEAAQEGRTVDQVAFVYRTWPAIQLAKQLIERGAIGTPRSFAGCFLQDYAADPNVPGGWRFQRARAGGGSLMDIGSHVIDVARYLVGDVDQVIATTERYVRHRRMVDEGDVFAGSDAGAGSTRGPATLDVDVDDAAVALLRFRNGATGTLRTGWSEPGHHHDLDFEVGGESGLIRFAWSRCNELAVSTTSRSGHEERIMLGPEHPGAADFWPVVGTNLGYSDAITAALLRLLRAADGRGARGPDFADGVAVLKTVDALMRSSESHQWTAV
jgi:predicted dehydrogenase